MLLILIPLLLLLPSSVAWGYFDPGFGGYLANSLISAIVSFFAFISAAVIYLFRKFISQKLIFFWQKHRRLLLLIILCVWGVVIYYVNSSSHHSHVTQARVIDPVKIFKGYNLFDGKLIDENGRIVRKWSHGYLGIIDRNGDYYGDQRDNNKYHRESVWGRYTWNDRLIWEKNIYLHHEIYLGPRDTIFTFTKETHDYNNYKVNFDTILEFDKNGNELQRYSLFDHLKEFAPYHAKFAIDTPALTPVALLYQYFGHNYDYFHLNSFFMIPPNPLESRNKAFRPGNWLISLYHASMVVILDQDSKKILWHMVPENIDGGLEGQHSVSMLPDGDLLLFDNGNRRKASRILIIDPLTFKIKWQYSNASFYSNDQGFVQALPNGNFLITESDKGHVFEVTPDKEKVWEYFNMESREGDIYRMTRYPQAMIDRFLLRDAH